MIKQHQKFKHDPDNFVYGDCHRTALACLLNLPVEDSPHFTGEYEDREKAKLMGREHPRFNLYMLEPEPYVWQDEQEKWLNSLGYTSVDIAYHGDQSIDGLFHYMTARNPEVYYILGGTSVRGTNHSVICHGGGFHWDPHPEGGFLVGPMSNGMWEVTFLVPLICKEKLDV